MKTGDWVIFKNENWNMYNILENENIVLHPETDRGVSDGSLVEATVNEIEL